MAQVCIVGAGSSGIVAAKTLHERGIPFDCFELGSGIGGVWRYNNDSGLSPAYRSLHINTSRQRMSFSDFPMPETYPDFPHHSLVLKYFENYVDHFGFRDRIQFNTRVCRVTPAREGTWLVTAQGRGAPAETRQYRSVIVANGHHWSPRLPEFEGEFNNRAMHSSDYRTPDDMLGKRVLVVGMGNSGCDITCEVARVAQRTFLSTRRGAHVMPKYLFGKPLDRLAPAWMWRYLPYGVFQRLFACALRIARGRLRRFGLPEPNHRILEEHPTISADLLNVLGHGRITVKPGITRLAEDRVEFVDGSSEAVDVIIYATGYNISFPFLSPTLLNPAGNSVRLYRRVVHPRHNRLFFVGLIQPWGAIMPLAEEQSKWVADLLAGVCGLPPRAAMEREMDKHVRRIQRRYVKSPRHTIQVDYFQYLDDIRKERSRARRFAVMKMPVRRPRSTWRPDLCVHDDPRKTVGLPTG